jgi:MFS family permease
MPSLLRLRGDRQSTDFLGMLVPAYMLPYGISTLFYGPFSDRVGRKPVILALLGLMVVTIAGVATAQTASQLMIWRLLGGIASGGIVPIALALLGDLFPYEQRGRSIGWMFGAMAGGMAFAIRLRQFLGGEIAAHPLSPGRVIAEYGSLFTSSRGAKAYAYILLNAMFHSGIFTWLGLYFSERYHLGDEGIGLALLGYGVPDMLFGPIIGRVVDRIGRKRIIPLGILIAALCGAALIPRAPLLWPAVVIAILSLGYDMSHPLLAGIITSLNPSRRGLAMGMNAFSLFCGFGLGALAFELLLKHGFRAALAVFAFVQLCLAVLAVKLFRGEDSSAGDHS